MSLNDFSDAWLSAFLGQRDSAATRREAEFVAASLRPNSNVLDIPCGYGRHGAILAELGHDVIGLDRDARMLSRARIVCTAVQAEMRQLPFARHSFDAAINMWQSFGYFSAAENAEVLAEFARIVRVGGLLVVDLYTRAFYESVTGERQFVRAGVAIRETTTLRSDRVNVQLTYGGGSARDEFEWQIFMPGDLENMAAMGGWELAGQFIDFDANKRAAAAAPRVQYTFRNTKGLTA